MDTTVVTAEPPAQCLENRPFSEIRIGDPASMVRQVTSRDIQLFAAVSGNVSPAHVDAAYARSTSFHQIIAHGMLGGSLISTVTGTRLPGPGTVYLGQTLRFLKPVHVGDTLTVTVGLTGRADSTHSRIASCAIALLWARRRPAGAA